MGNIFFERSYLAPVLINLWKRSFILTSQNTKFLMISNFQYDKVKMDKSFHAVSNNFSSALIYFLQIWFCFHGNTAVALSKLFKEVNYCETPQRSIILGTCWHQKGIQNDDTAQLQCLLSIHGKASPLLCLFGRNLFGYLLCIDKVIQFFIAFSVKTTWVKVISLLLRINAACQ